jgi:hypothetical protein
MAQWKGMRGAKEIILWIENSEPLYQEWKKGGSVKSIVARACLFSGQTYDKDARLLAESLLKAK